MSRCMHEIYLLNTIVDSVIFSKNTSKYKQQTLHVYTRYTSIYTRKCSKSKYKQIHVYEKIVDEYKPCIIINHTQLIYWPHPFINMAVRTLLYYLCCLQPLLFPFSTNYKQRVCEKVQVCCHKYAICHQELPNSNFLKKFLSI